MIYLGAGALETKIVLIYYYKFVPSFKCGLLFFQKTWKCVLK